MNAEDLIARNTRAGHTSWSNVARQLGRSVDSVRAQFDPTYMRAHIWAPSREPQPEMIPDENDLRSPHPKGPGLKCEIAQALAISSACAETIAARLNRPINSIRARLAEMQANGIVKPSSGPRPRTWSLIAGVTACALGGMEGA